MTDALDTPSDEPCLVCPACGAAMAKVNFHDIVVDRCTQCHGLWFDALEREHLAEIAGSETIDDGEAQAARPVHRRLNCPVCHTQMIEMTDHRHPSLHFESCTVCYGIFHNAGEFKSVAEHSIPQTFKIWLGRGKNG